MLFADGPFRRAPRHSKGRVSWVDTDDEKAAAGEALSTAFVASLLLFVLAGVLTLGAAPRDDRDAEGLRERLDGEANGGVLCLRAARRADYAIAFVALGAPAQHLKLLVRFDRVVPTNFAESTMRVYSERLHKSLTMHCEPFSPSRPYEELCEDVGMLFNGTHRQRYVRTRFTYANDYVERSSNNRAALLGLDGELYLQAGTVYWLTSSHLCYAPSASSQAPYESHPDALSFSVGADQRLYSFASELQAFAPTQASPVATAIDACPGLLNEPTPVRIFPSDAANERITWLSLSDTFLYQYGNSILERRRTVLEVGQACAELTPELKHINDLYRLDCAIIDPSWCQVEPALPFRRLADHQLRIEISGDGTEGTLRAKRTEALARVPGLLSYGDGLGAAIARLCIMLLTAAVVFVRGSQNASSSRYMLEHVLDTIRCRAQNSKHPTDYRWALFHNVSEIAVDAAITLVALGSRIIVIVLGASALVADQMTFVVVVESVGAAASAAHFALRYAVLKWDLAREAPLTKLAGPMSICDVSSAVLVAFSESPLLSNDEGRFPAVGRLLIGIMIAISVVTRCAFAAPMCRVLANTVTNDEVAYKDLRGYWSVLIAATGLWIVQGVVACISTAALFVSPAAYAVSRMQTGAVVDMVPYAIFLGLLCAGLPTVTKVALRTFEHECTEVYRKEL